MITEEGYKAVMRNLASGVTVVTTLVDSEPHGMTATSFTAVSLDPMLVLVSLDRSSRTHDGVKGARFFAVNLLSESQEQIARQFAVSGVDRFDSLPVVEGKNGLPLIKGALAGFECEVVDEFLAGDHTIFLGRPIEAYHTDELPLLYFRGGYCRVDLDIDRLQIPADEKE